MWSCPLSPFCYVDGTAEQVSKGYQPLLRMDGTPFVLGASEIEGSTCGVWVERDSESLIEQTGQELKVRRGGE
jgi:hypothetical protein